MTRQEELKLFLDSADELIASKYILADVKIVNLLKSISVSESLIAVFQNCLSEFNYIEAKNKYLVKSEYLSSDKGEFVMPPNTKELLAFVFTVLLDIDAKRIDFAQFLTTYFYEDNGSFTAGYSAFINSMIKPFRNSVKQIMESVIEGTIADPIDAFIKEEQRKAEEQKNKEEQQKKDKALLEKANGEKLKTIKDLLLEDTQKIKASKKDETTKKQMLMIVNLFANVLDGEDTDGIYYAYVSYKFMAKVHCIMFSKNFRKITKLLKGIINDV